MIEILYIHNPKEIYLDKFCSLMKNGIKEGSLTVPTKTDVYKPIIYGPEPFHTITPNTTNKTLQIQNGRCKMATMMASLAQLSHYFVE